MTKVVIHAGLLGSVGGILKSLCLFISWAFDPQGQDSWFDRFSLAVTLGVSAEIIPYLAMTLDDLSYCRSRCWRPRILVAKVCRDLATAMAFLLSSLSMRVFNAVSKIAIYPIEGSYTVGYRLDLSRLSQ